MKIPNTAWYLSAFRGRLRISYKWVLAYRIRVDFSEPEVSDPCSMVVIDGRARQRVLLERLSILFWCGAYSRWRN